MLGKVVDGVLGMANAWTPGAGATANYLIGGSSAAYGVDQSDSGAHTYMYFTYEMPKAYDVTSLYYACSWKSTSDASWGANSLAVYVGDDLSAVHAGTVEPNAIYDGTIGKTYVDGGDTGVRAVRFDFNEAVSGRYITFRLLSCTNSDSATKGEQVWISEFAALGTTDAPEDEEEPPVDPEEGEAAQYEVYRRTGSGSWSKVASTTKTGYTDKTAKKGKYYTYRVRAVYSKSKSVFKTGSKTKR